MLKNLHKRMQTNSHKPQKKILKNFVVFLIAIIASNFLVANAGEFSLRGNIELQGRLFFEEALRPQQPDYNFSFAAVPEFYWESEERNNFFEFIPSIRIDENDDERTHGDIRELSWIHVGDAWESRIGVRRVFWGVTEFQHLVDIINQSDAVEDIDNEDKLGQPMLNISWVKDWGIIDLFVLPYFRERTFAGEKGRPGISAINSDIALYENSQQEKHIDWAARWTHSIDIYELGLSWFQGTAREPLLISNPANPGELVPFYQQIKQLGLELQANIGDILFKLEVIHNQNNLQDFSATQIGIEYTVYGIAQSKADLGWLVEYAWDERGKNSNSIFQNDIFFGSRLALNDIQSSELLAGLSYDVDFKSSSFLLEASRRFGNNIKLLLDLRFFHADAADSGALNPNQPTDPLFFLRRDDHIQLTLQYFY